MKVELKYGLTSVSGSLPFNDVKMLTPNAYHADKFDVNDLLLSRLNTPTAGVGLSNILRPGESVVVVVSDITRTWNRTRDFLPALLHYLGEHGIKEKDITILVARGCHRSQSQEELMGIVGKENFEKYEVVEHNPDFDDGLTYVGTTKRGNEIFVNSRVAEADRVILTGGIIHHAMAGFGGGRKSILPGISGRKTVERNHLNVFHPTELRINPAIGSNKTVGNPIHEDMVEAASFVQPDFLVNVVIDQNGDIADFFTGNWFAAWESGCKLVNEIYGVDIDYQADLVVASCGGSPYDISLYQASKTFYNAGLVTKPGGVLILLVQAEDGPGSDDFFGWFDNQSPEEYHKNLHANFSVAGYLAYLIYTIAQERTVYVISDVEDELVRKMSVQPCESLQKAIDEAAKNLKPDCRVIVMPEGGITFPMVKKC